MTKLAFVVVALLGCGASGPCPSCAEPAVAACPAAETPSAVGGDGSSPKTTPGQTPPAMVRVPAGEFLRGSREDVGLKDEHPQRKIFLDTFDIDRTEVSVGDYGKCVSAGACAAASCTEDGDEPEKRTGHPVVCVTWSAAEKYCERAGKRLPTEAEWEKAARGTGGAKFPWGEGEPSCNRANHDACGKERKPVDSHPEGKSPYGALNMAGNVYEWVGDWHHRAYYALSPERNPQGPWSGEKKVVRGGAYSYDADELNSHGRTYDRPVKAYDQVGFRCAKSAQ
jgi:formylglycine-generating enzyme required for sulfatase activity